MHIWSIYIVKCTCPFVKYWLTYWYNLLWEPINILVTFLFFIFVVNFFSINLSMCKSVISFVIITFTDCNWDDGSKYRKYWPRTEEHSSIESTSCPGCLLGMLHDTTCQDFIKHYNNYNVIVMYIYLRILLQFYLA